ncbi:MAG: hypothetical protein RL722_634 [Pseudomonadota bacterium]|jgi:capsular polysaccharide transport system permease protein
MIKFLTRHLLLGLVVLSTLLAALYWLVLASDRFVSEAHVIVQRTDLGSTGLSDLTSLLSGASGGGGRADQLLLRDYLQSADLLRKLDARLQLRQHYAHATHDLLSRHWQVNDHFEAFHQYMRGRISVEIDEYAGVLVIRAQAYEPGLAQSLNRELVKEGELFLNELGRNLARDQVDFLERQVAQMQERALQARAAVVDFQNDKGMASPEAEAKALVGIIAKLEGTRTELQTQRNALQSYLVPDHPNVVMLDQQLAAINRQIAAENARLAAPKGSTLNRTVEQIQRLEMEAVFAQDVYRTGLVALEKGRFEAARNIKKVSVLLAPTHPEAALEPRRFYNAFVSLLLALALGSIAYLSIAIVRDHRD